MLRTTSSQLRIVARQDRALIDHDDLGAEPAERLGELAADRPAAEHQQPPWQLRQIEDCLVGQAVQFRQPRHRRDRRPAAGRDHVAPGTDLPAAHLDQVGAGKPCLLAQNRHAQPLEALDAVVRGDAVDHTADVPTHGGEVDARDRRGDTEGRARACRMGGRGSGDQALGWHAADIEAVAAHRSALDQHDRGTQLGRARSHAETARACADDADVGGQGLVHREGPCAARSPSAMRDYRWSIGPATTAQA